MKAREVSAIVVAWVDLEVRVLNTLELLLIHPPLALSVVTDSRVSL